MGHHVGRCELEPASAIDIICAALTAAKTYVLVSPGSLSMGGGSMNVCAAQEYNELTIFRMGA